MFDFRARSTVRANILALLFLVGCATPASQRGEEQIAGDEPASLPPLEEGQPLPTTPAALTRASAVRTAVLPLCTVPYDNFVLPLVAPDGRMLATESGVPPEWSTVLAEPGAPEPLATSVEIYQLTFEERKAQRTAVLDGAVILGRSCDESGFLIEHQFDDGTRSIGKAAWTSGAIEWLVENDSVNAFACLGSQGRLTWSRCAVDGDYFSLVVRQPDGSEWSAQTAGGHWLFPTFSQDGESLFVLRLTDRKLELIHGAAGSRAAFEQSIRSIPLSDQGSLHLAYQVMNGQPLTVGLPPSTHDELVFFHPTQGRAALWRPYSRSARQVTLFDRGSFTAVLNEDGMTALVATGSDLWQQSLTDARDQVSLLKGVLIPRATARSEWRYLLLTPLEGEIGLTAMQLLPAEPLNSARQ